MALICLPCEVYQREFDAKLLLAVRLASDHSHTVLIGYDKYFNHAIPQLGPCLLLDKSLSAIMLQGRIAPTIHAGGRVIVCDEEGVNNVGIMGEESWLARIHPKAVKMVDLYACWGHRDAEFFQGVTGLKEKMAILGNCRSDLLNSIGRRFYQPLIHGLGDVFGDFVLVSDNFALERFGYQGMPRLAKDMKTHSRLQKEYAQWENEARIRRKHFTALLQHAVMAMPTKQFVIRPHPRSHPGWWHEHFGAYRNVQVINRHAVEPWIHAARAVVSMGCTTGLQALVAGKAVVEVATPSLATHGLVSRLLPRHVASEEEFTNELAALSTNQQIEFDRVELERSWVNTTRSSTKFFARACDYIADSLPVSSSNSPPRIQGLDPEMAKWSENPTTQAVHEKVRRASAALGCSHVKIKKVSMAVWQLSGARH